MTDQRAHASKQVRADELVAHPAESLNVELKTWLDLSDDEHVAKFVKAVLAIRNRNGGFLVIGFNDKTLLPDPYPLSNLLEEAYHHDAVQGLVSRYAHESFEIEVQMGKRDGILYPVIAVPEGVRTPVAVKRDLAEKTTQKVLLLKGEIFFRTLSSNGTPSSARVAPADLSALMEVCFDNREADIGRFLRRQLGGTGAEALRAFLVAGTGSVAMDPLRARAEALILRGDAAFAAAHANSPLSEQEAPYLNGLTMRVGMVAEPLHLGALATVEFMNRIASANPQYTGWPAWLDPRYFRKEQNRGHVQDGAWIAFIRGGSVGERDRLEFMLYDPRGDFYSRRVMQDDTADTIRPFTALDPVLMLYRVAEFIAAGISVLRGAGWLDEEKAGFAFSWSGLNARKLISWSTAMRSDGAGEGNESRTDIVASYVEVALDTPHLALAPAVERAVAPLFACFNGYQPPSNLVEEAVRALVERRL